MKRSSVLIPAVLVLTATCGFGAYHKLSGLPNGPTGAIQFNDGTDFAGSSSLTWNESAGTLTANTTIGSINLGNNSYGGTHFALDAMGESIALFSTATFMQSYWVNITGSHEVDIDCPGTLYLGDVAGDGNGSLWIMDDFNQKTTSNVPHYAEADCIFTSSAAGPTIKDSANGHWYTISVTNGTIGLVDRGITLP